MSVRSISNDSGLFSSLCFSLGRNLSLDLLGSLIEVEANSKNQNNALRNSLPVFADAQNCHTVGQDAHNQNTNSQRNRVTGTTHCTNTADNTGSNDVHFRAITAGRLTGSVSCHQNQARNARAERTESERKHTNHVHINAGQTGCFRIAANRKQVAANHSFVQQEVADDEEQNQYNNRNRNTCD